MSVSSASEFWSAKSPMKLGEVKKSGEYREGPENGCADALLATLCGRLAEDLAVRCYSVVQRRRFPREEMAKGKTPDYRLRLAKGELVGFAEIKSPRDDFLDDLLEGTAGEIVGGLRQDPIFNRIERHIKTAADQFDAVNANGEVPNIMVFVNHDDASDVRDLAETVTGYLRTDDGTQHPTMLPRAQRVRAATAKIDLFIWIDAKRQQPLYRFNDGSAKVAEICKLLGLDATAIK